jgi:hypothetical protein
MRIRALALLALLTTCGPDYTRSMPLGGHDVAVAIVDCREPQRGLIAAEVEYFGWHVSEAGEVSVRCVDTGPTGGAGMLVLGASEVLIDPVKAPGLAARQVAGHELIHALIHRGPHPERARLHICDLAYNESAPAGCAPGLSAKNALMSPSLGGSAGWNGDYETFGIGALAEYRVTAEDHRFIVWALGTAP